MPVVAWGLCQLMHLPTDLALGVILVGCCPGGTASNVITYIAGGDVALSVGMTITSTLAAPLMTPLLVHLLAGAWVEVSFLAMVISVVKVVLIPVLLGILINWIFGKQIQKISEVLPLISVVSIVMIISGIVSVNAEKILSCGLLVLGVVALHNLCGMGIGLGAAKLLHIEYDKATAIAIEVGMQNSGLAISLATANFAANPLATLPGAISPNISCPMSDNRSPPVNVPVLSPHCNLNPQSFSQPLRFGDKTSPSDSVHHKPAPSVAFLLHLICNTYSILHHEALRYTGSSCFGSESSVSFLLCVHIPSLRRFFSPFLPLPG